MRAFILGPNQELLPIGAPGEIYLSGVQVATGYITCEEKDKGRFMSDPWFGGLRMFRTGNRGRFTEAMEIEYLGRLDREIKLRGFRVNLDEIESVVLQASTATKPIGALVWRESLVAFVSPGPVSREEINKIRSTLPYYSIPLRFVDLPAMPRSVNQKIDYNALEALLSITSLQNKDPMPSDEGAKLIAQIWEELLCLLVSSVSAYDDFAVLGRHSIL